jgi:S-adenosylmethionine-dependent methyltransferase
VTLAEMTTNTSDERFLSGAAQYAAYLETPEGRLRLDLSFANLREFLPQATRGLRALDLGAGTGVLAVRLAQLGFHVTLLDASSEMLDIAQHTAVEAGVAERIALTRGEAGQLANLVEVESFDLILCHNILEFIDNPSEVLGAAARVLRDTSSIISVLVRNRAGEVTKAALLNGDLTTAARNLTAERGDESLYGGKVRLFTPDNLRAMLIAVSFAVIAERGVRVVSDFLPPKVSRTDEYERIFELERKLGAQPEFAAVARYSHFLARRRGPLMKIGL